MTAVRRSTPRHKWDEIADVIVSVRQKVEAELKADAPPSSFRALLPNLKQRSHVKIPGRLRNAAELREYFRALPVHKGAHLFSFEGRPQPLPNVRADFPMAGYSSDFVPKAPGLLEVLNDPSLIDLIEQYLGCVPTLYSLKAWWTFPADKPEMTNVQFFHRDTDDGRFLTPFLYLTDVGPDGGPYEVVPGSHSLDGMKTLLNAVPWWRSRMDVERSFIDDMGEDFSSTCEQHFKNAAVQLTGPAGSMFLVNTLALHRGIVPTQTDRLIIGAHYGLGPNTNSAGPDQASGNAPRAVYQSPARAVRPEARELRRAIGSARSRGVRGSGAPCREGSDPPGPDRPAPGCRTG